MTVETLYERFRDELIRFALCMTGDRASAEDLVQDAFFSAVLHEAQLNELGEKQARSWLYRTVKNRFIDRVRRARAELLTDAVPETAVPPAAMNETEWQMLLAALPAPDGELLWLHDVEGCTSEQLGERFGMPPGTVRYRLHDARKQLKRMLGGNRDV